MQSQIIGPFYLPTIGVPSLASTMEIDGNDHRTRWFEVDASRRGAEYFDKHYGSGSDGYFYKSEEHFDVASFESGEHSPYKNPRTGTRYNKGFPISKSIQSFWDYAFPVILKQEIPTFILQIFK